MRRLCSHNNVFRVFSVGLILAVSGTTDLAVAGPPREMKLDMEFDAFEKEFDRQTARGFRLIDVSIYQVGTRDLYSGIWEERADPPIALRHGMSRDELLEKTAELAEDRYGLIYIEGKGGGGREKFAGIWEPCTGLFPQVWIGMNSVEFKKKYDELAAMGFQMTSLSAYELDGQILLAGLWNKSDEFPEAVLEANLTMRQLSAAVRRKLDEGFRISRLSACLVKGQDRYTCLWKKMDGPIQDVRVGMSATALKRFSRQMDQKGLQPIQISVFANGKQLRYSVVWEDNSDAK
jgi:hypothetical protein